MFRLKPSLKSKDISATSTERSDIVAKEYDPGKDDEVEFKILSEKHGHRVTCKADGWSSIEVSEAEAAKQMGIHMGRRHPGKVAKKL